jgi:hypothetical protein
MPVISNQQWKVMIEYRESGKAGRRQVIWNSEAEDPDLQ